MSNFIDQLTRSNKEIKQERAERIGKLTANQLRTELMNTQQEIMEIEDELERQLDVSTDNQSTTINRIQDWDAGEFISKRARLKLNLRRLKEEKMPVLTEMASDLFGEELAKEFASDES